MYTQSTSHERLRSRRTNIRKIVLFSRLQDTYRFPSHFEIPAWLTQIWVVRLVWKFSGAEDTEAHPPAPSSLAWQLPISITGELLSSLCGNEVSRAQCLEMCALTPVSHGGSVELNSFLETLRQNPFSCIFQLLETTSVPWLRATTLHWQSQQGCVGRALLLCTCPPPSVTVPLWAQLGHRLCFHELLWLHPHPRSPSINSLFENFQQQSHRQSHCSLVGCSEVVRAQKSPGRVPNQGMSMWKSSYLPGNFGKV